jgi:hypothetical protein
MKRRPSSTWSASWTDVVIDLAALVKLPGLVVAGQRRAVCAVPAE